MKFDKKYLYVLGAVVIILLVGWFIFGRGASKQTGTPKPTEAVIPTVDSSVQVSLTADSAKRNLLLSVSGMPSGTTSLDYEISYQTASQGLQGAIGNAAVAGQSTFQKSITLGTCSSGRCVYHQVVGSIKLSLKFSGDYGEKIFEKEYSI